MFLLIDNFDSFTFNLVQAFYKLGRSPEVLRNDRPELLELAEDPRLEMVCISPGPGHPVSAGLCLTFLEKLPQDVPVLGVCLGHQVLGHFAGATVDVGHRIMHGKTTDIEHNGRGLFTGLANPLRVGRYHSLLVRTDETPDKIEATAWTDQGEAMALRWLDRPWVGVQFHPESVLTPDGPALLENFPKALI
jgi:anthranilate synthase/aminodeoxychorismate synthase-like glutamine amidotransferase